MSRKTKIDPKYRDAYDRLTLAEVINLRDSLTRDVAAEGAAAQGGGLRAEVAAANRRELLLQLNAIEARFEKLAKEVR